MGKSAFYKAVDDLSSFEYGKCPVCTEEPYGGSTLCKKHGPQWSQITENQIPGWGATESGWNSFAEWILTHPDNPKRMPVATVVYPLLECPACEQTKPLVNDYICGECRYG